MEPDELPELTPEMVRGYVDSGGTSCPYCGSFDIECETPELDGPSAWSLVACPNCGAHYHDVYFLGAIDVLEQNGLGHLDTVSPATPVPSTTEAVAREDLLRMLLDGAEAHGVDEPDHETGDMIEFFSAAFRLLTTEQLAAFWADPIVNGQIGPASDYSDLAELVYGPPDEVDQDTTTQ